MKLQYDETGTKSHCKEEKFINDRETVLPGLSWLFSRTGTSVQNRKMLILIRSKIVLMEELEPDPATLPTDTVSMR